jgi:hypothetical protein
MRYQESEDKDCEIAGVRENPIQALCGQDGDEAESADSGIATATCPGNQAHQSRKACRFVVVANVLAPIKWSRMNSQGVKTIQLVRTAPRTRSQNFMNHAGSKGFEMVGHFAVSLKTIMSNDICEEGEQDADADAGGGAHDDDICCHHIFCHGG